MASRSDISAGQAYVRLYTQTKDYDDGLAKAKRRLQDFGTAVTIAGALTATVVSTAIVAPLARAVQSYISIGSEIDDVSQRIGVSTSELFEFQYAAERTDASLGDVEASIRSLSRFMADAIDGSDSAKKSLAGIGLTVDQLKDKSPDQQFQLIADRISGIQDPAKRTSAAMDILGRSGAKLLPMMAELNELREEARRLGLVPTEEAVKQAAQIGDLMDSITAVTRAGVFEIGAAISPALTPGITFVRDLGGAFVTFIKQNGEAVRQVAKVGAIAAASGAGVAILGSGIHLAGRGIGLLQTGLKAFTPLVNPAAVAIEGLVNLVDMAGRGGEVIGKAFRVSSDWVVRSAAASAGAVGSLATTTWKTATSMGSAIASGASTLYSGLTSRLAQMATEAPGFFNRVSASARTAFSAARDAGSAFMQGWNSDLGKFTTKSRQAFSIFGSEARYWLTRPWEYLRVVAPQTASFVSQKLQQLTAFMRSQASSGSSWMRDRWNSASTAISGAMATAASRISARWPAIAGSITNALSGAWQFVILSSVDSANRIVAPFLAAGTRIGKMLGPVLPMLQKDFGKIAGYAGASFSGMVVASRVTAGAIVATFRYAGPTIARNMTAAFASAFSRIRSMGTATAGFLSRGVGTVGRGVGGLLSSGAGLLSLIGGGAGGVVGELAQAVPLILMLGSALGALISPAGLAIAALAGGVYLWTQYSESGQKALATLTNALRPYLEIAKQTFGGIYDAIKAGDLALAGRIALAGLRVAFLQGMDALGTAIGGTWGSTVKDLAVKISSGDFVGAWSTAVKGMAAIWDSFAAGMVKTFSQAAGFVVDKWKSTVNNITDFLIEASAQGGAMGAMASAVLGVDMKKENERSALMNEKENRELSRRLEETVRTQEAMRERALASGDMEQVRKIDIGIASNKARISELQGGGPGPSSSDQAKEAARAITEGTADAIQRSLDQMQQDADERAQMSNAALENSLPSNVEAAVSDAVLQAQAELDRLTREAAEKRAQVEREREENQPNFDEGNFGGSPVNNVVGTFSAAAAASLVGGNPQLEVAREQLKEQREAKRVQKQMLIIEEKMIAEFERMRARAG